MNNDPIVYNVELSYDKYNFKAEQFYRIRGRALLQGREFTLAVPPAPAGATFVKGFPEVIQYIRFLPLDNM